MIAALAILALLLTSCATVRDREAHPHPTVTNPIAACHISCPDGWLNERMHACRGDRQWTEDIQLTGGEDEDGDPSAARWFTGSTSILADSEVQRRLAAAHVGPLDKAWPRMYGEFLSAIRKDLGDAAFASYPKDEVVLMRCEQYRRERCSSLADAERPCAAHPGEPDPLHPDRTAQ